MAILAALIAAGSRFATKILTTTLGWASTLLFGRVPASRQFVLVVFTFGSVIWIVLVAGVLFPSVGTFLLLLIPSQDVVPEAVIRAVMLVGALLLPAVVGLMLAWLMPPQDRHGRQVVEVVARGYPLTVLLAVLLFFLAGLAVVRRARSLARRWTDAHVPLIVMPGEYENVARDLDAAISAAGLDVEPRPASALMSSPARWLARVAGPRSVSLVPDRMVELRGPGLEILIYPMDLLISGTPTNVMRARAAMASRLTTSAAHLTVSAEAQAIEDRVTRLARGSEDGTPPIFGPGPQEELRAIDEGLATLDIPYDEWEVLYRERLQVERDLRARAMAQEIDLSTAIPAVRHALREGADVVYEVATDETTITTLDRMAGPVWSIAVRVLAATAASAMRALRGASRRQRTADMGDAVPSGHPVERP